jgi:hypothetical protein
MEGSSAKEPDSLKGFGAWENFRRRCWPFTRDVPPWK